MRCFSRHSMDGPIRVGDVVVSHVNGTLDFYVIATVVSAVEDLTLHCVLTTKGQDAAIKRGYEQRSDDQDVWLFAGSAAAYVKAPAPQTDASVRQDPPVTVERQSQTFM
jgi:hypothetical protein